MAALERLVKTVESLKLYNTPGAPTTGQDNQMSKKEKMSHCLSVTETLCSSSPAIKANPEFSKYLSMSMEMYFALLDDQDSGRVYVQTLV